MRPPRAAHRPPRLRAPPRPHLPALARWLLLLVLAPALAGCLEPRVGQDPPPDGDSTPVSDVRVTLEPSGMPADEARGSDEFWMVRVEGHEERERKPGRAEVVCSILWDHDLDAPNRTLAYARSHDFDPEKVVAITAFDHFARWSSCPIAYTVQAGPSVEQDMGRYGNLSLMVEDDGTLLMGDGTRVPLGQRAVVDYGGRMSEGRDEYDVDGTFVVENLGAWPRDRLVSR